MTVGELLDALAKMPREALIVVREPIEDTGEYETIEVVFDRGEVILDIQ